jgi:hypothetical protein
MYCAPFGWFCSSLSLLVRLIIEVNNLKNFLLARSFCLVLVLEASPRTLARRTGTTPQTTATRTELSGLPRTLACCLSARDFTCAASFLRAARLRARPHRARRAEHVLTAKRIGWCGIQTDSRRPTAPDPSHRLVHRRGLHADSAPFPPILPSFSSSRLDVGHSSLRCADQHGAARLRDTRRCRRLADGQQAGRVHGEGPLHPRQQERRAHRIRSQEGLSGNRESNSASDAALHCADVFSSPFCL